MARAIATARLVLGGAMNVQAPPNLSPNDIELFLRAGINDWGGISPLTRDYVNPEAPWPHVEQLADRCARAGFRLHERLPVYQEYINERMDRSGAAAGRRPAARRAPKPAPPSRRRCSVNLTELRNYVDEIESTPAGRAAGRRFTGGARGADQKSRPRRIDPRGRVDALYLPGRRSARDDQMRRPGARRRRWR